MQADLEDFLELFRPPPPAKHVRGTYSPTTRGGESGVDDDVDNDESEDSANDDADVGSDNNDDADESDDSDDVTAIAPDRNHDPYGGTPRPPELAQLRGRAQPQGTAGQNLLEAYFFAAALSAAALTATGLCSLVLHAVPGEHVRELARAAATVSKEEVEARVRVSQAFIVAAGITQLAFAAFCARGAARAVRIATWYEVVSSLLYWVNAANAAGGLALIGGACDMLAYPRGLDAAGAPRMPSVEGPFIFVAALGAATTAVSLLGLHAIWREDPTLVRMYAAAQTAAAVLWAIACILVGAALTRVDKLIDVRPYIHFRVVRLIVAMMRCRRI